jgi:two-component system alkaline phosphatase synthesis response regulator PhoP
VSAPPHTVSEGTGGGYRCDGQHTDMVGPRLRANTRQARQTVTGTVLVVDDDRKIVELLKLYLERDGYHVLVAYDGLAALGVARRAHPDIILLDLMLPSIDGLDVCRVLQAESGVPVIMLTARTTDEDKLTGLGMGADDYVTKPFNPREVMVRVRAVLRRAENGTAGGDGGVRQIADLAVDRRGHEVRLRGTPVNLTPTEFRLLDTLADEPGRAFTRLELLDRVYGHEFEGLDRTIDVHVANLRRKIEQDPRDPTYIKTVFGVGYKLAGI